MATVRERLETLKARRERSRGMGGKERIDRQKQKGKLTARERLDLLFDPGTFEEYGALAGSGGNLPDEEDKPSPADGVITGVGEVEGRPTCAALYDFTVFGGSIGEVGEKKVARLRDIALKSRIPMVWLVDSGGARIEAGSGSPDARRIASFADTGYLFREEVILSGVVPLVSGMLGPGAAGTAYIPGLADYVPMVKGTSSMAIGGPYLVQSTVGEKVSEEELGGSRIHNELSGVADGEFANDPACIAAIREYLGFFPSHSGAPPPRQTTTDPITRGEESLLDVVPDNPKRAYDMHKVIEAIVDEKRFFPMKPKWARNIITALARIDGRPVGIVASNPMFYGGVLDVNASDKAARFINLCDAFNVPLLFLVDVPGFMVGTKVEQQGIIRHGSKMMFAVASATVPKITVVVRKAYGAGYYVMCGRAFEPDLLVAWPSAEIGLMGPEGMVSIGARKMLEAQDSPEAKAQLKAQLADALRPHIDIFRAAAMALVDDVIDPRETRRVVARALKRTEHKVVERPRKKREVMPV
ncbi:MAG TPA: acyl-CoA carboxylase subunit beta [Myxococcaceae bacterium]|nr:acyl-CoA carboxylase subunit beta [Myxococcaceae bacterium]